MTARPLKYVLPIVAALGLAQALSCKDSDSVVRIAVEGPAALPAFTMLRASLSNGGVGDTKVYPLAPGGAIVLPTAFTVTISHQRSGPLDIELDALNAQGPTVASGAGTVELQSGGTVSVTITLAAGASLCGNGIRDSGEQCDDGDRFTNGTCDYLCRDITGAGGHGGTNAGSGGTSGTGSGGHVAVGSGGAIGTGGVPIVTGTGGHGGNGMPGSGGKAAGGAPGTGGVSSTGGSPVVGTGGAPPLGSGGMVGTGGVSSGGSGTGGRGSGGVVGTGGLVGTGGAGGMPASGGVTGTAGTIGSGGTTASGGSTGAGGGGTACAGELLANGGFESGTTGWTATSATNSAIVYARNDAELTALGVTPASGDYLAWLGRDLPSGEDLLASQPINVSSQASGLLLQGLVRIAGGSNSSCAANCMPTLSVEVQNGATVQVIKTWTPADVTNAWTAFNAPLTDGVLVNGSVLRLHLVIQDGVTFNVFFDQLSLQARVCN